MLHDKEALQQTAFKATELLVTRIVSQLQGLHTTRRIKGNIFAYKLNPHENCHNQFH